MSELKKKITEVSVSEELLDSAHVLVTQEEQQADGTSIESLRRVPLAKFPASKPGQDGGYYKPSVTQPDDGTVEFNFTPSREGIPEVPVQSVKLPKGTGGSGVHVGTEEPEDEDVDIWIDPDGEPVNLMEAPKQAKVGQTIVVSAVDENGVPVAWEAADLPAGGTATPSGDGEWTLLAEKTFSEADLGTSRFEWDCENVSEIVILANGLRADKDMGWSLMINGTYVTGNIAVRTTEGEKWQHLIAVYRGPIWDIAVSNFDYASRDFSPSTHINNGGKLEEGLGKACKIGISQSAVPEYQIYSGNMRVYVKQ